jgi:hypothetical protein
MFEAERLLLPFLPFASANRSRINHVVMVAENAPRPSTFQTLSVHSVPMSALRSPANLSMKSLPGAPPTCENTNASVMCTFRRASSYGDVFTVCRHERAAPRSKPEGHHDSESVTGEQLLRAPGLG